MGLFSLGSRVATNYDDAGLDDTQWLRAGESRYKSLVSRHYGSPDTIAVGGDQRSRAGDEAAALFFYQKAIDTLHSIYVCGFGDQGPSGWRRQPSDRDLLILDLYLGTLRAVRACRAAAPVAASVKEVTDRMRTISSQFRRYGLDPVPYLERLDQLAELAPDVDVNDIFWS